MAAANPVQGEISFETQDGKTWVAVYDIPAICAMEDALDRSAIQIMAQIGMGRVGFIRMALWAGLRRKHPKLTLDQVDEIMTKIKGRGAAEIVTEGVRAAFPKPDDQDDDDSDSDGEGGDADPPPAPGEDGTGASS